MSASEARASAAVVSVGRSSYSIHTRSAASAASWEVSATTAATGSP